MAIKKFCEKIILIILTISILLSFIATPVSNAGLDLGDGEFYYSGTTKGTYVLTEGIFEWLIDNLGKIADWLVGLFTMPIRMIVVGWTALIEKLLTWSVEQTGGISNSGGLVVDSTDVTAIGDSSGNLTVQAIVYNQVPLFDINFFNLETDKTVSPTGQTLRCEKCKKTCEECCALTKDNLPTDDNTTVSCQGTDGCDCDCSNCEQYLANWKADNETDEPLVIKIREFVAMWYTIIRLLSLIAMLIVLIAIGIKMALSTIASEKAIYKRMLVDWVVGIIILFSMHYFIYFVITINEILVDTVKETANSINKTQLQFVNSGEQSSEDDSQIIYDDEIEISLYEEIRSRAYDAKLSVGLSGMIMYVTLLYFAIRYSISYLKRYLTVIVLSLMAPPLGVAYALQKALTGKSSSLKTWMTEFVMTVIIQVIHALIYAVFISTALALSMESVAGMIVALIFMNFALKAEKIFREIFRMGGSDSLAGSAAEAGNAENIRSKINAVTSTAMSAKPIANVMMNTPLAKGIKAGGKLGLAAGAAGVNALVNRKNKNSEETQQATDSEKDVTENNSKSENQDTTSGQNNPAISIPPTSQRVGSKSTDSNATSDNGNTSQNDSGTESQTMAEEEETQGILKSDGNELRNNFAAAVQTLQDPKATPTQKANARKDMDKYVQYQMLMNPDGVGKGKSSIDSIPGSVGIFGAHLKKAVNITNHFQNTATSTSGLKNGYRAIFGTKHKDPKTGKMVYDGNGYFSQFNATNLLGLSEKDKKYIKENGLIPLKAAFGSIQFMAGLATVVAHPAIGTAGIAFGANGYAKAYKQLKGYGRYKGTYGKARFPAQTVQNSQQQLLKNAYTELANVQSTLDKGMIERVKAEKPELYNSIMEDLRRGGTYKGLSVSGNILPRQYKNARGAEFSTVPPKKWSRMPELFDARGSTANMGIGDYYALQRAKEETAAFEKEGANLLKFAHQQEWDLKKERQDERIQEDAELYIESLAEISEGTSNDNDSQRSKAEAKAKLDEIVEKSREFGYTINEKTKKLERTNTIKPENFNSVGKGKAIQIETTIDAVLTDMYKVSGKVDVSSTEDMESTIKAVTARLKDNGTLDKKHSIESLFKDKETVKKTLEDKADIFNKQISVAVSNTQSIQSEQSAKDKLDEIISGQKEFSEKERKLIKQVVLEKGTSTSAKDVMNAVSTQIGMQNQGKKQPVSSKSKGKHITKAQVKDEQKRKEKAVGEFLQTLEAMKVPEATSADVAREVKKSVAVDDSLNQTVLERSVERTNKKIKTVLQFMTENGDATIAEMMDSTATKVKNAKKGIQGVDGKKLEFNDTEAEALQSLFDKMKEEVVFNEYTKNVLDQKDSEATKKAKQKVYAKNVEYLTAKRDVLYNADNIANNYRKYGVEASNIDNMINKNSSVGDEVSEIVGRINMETLMSDKMITKDINLEGETKFENLDVRQQKKMKNNLTEYLKKSLEGEVSGVKNARKAQLDAQKTATLVGKIDIMSQLDKLDK